jgi:hypothetical protein
MIPSWAYLDQHERSVFRAAVAFLNNRLAEPSAVEWAAQLGSDRRIERSAIEHLLSTQTARAAGEPWATAWRLIEESWSEKPIESGPSTSVYNIQARLRAGDRSGAIISAIVDLVSPRLKVEPVSSSSRQFSKIPRRPKTVRHLLSTGLTSGELVDLNALELARIDDLPFLRALASALESAVDHGLDIGRRIGWDGQGRLWQLGSLYRVYYVVPGRRTQDGIEDPDAYHHGIAPSVKLLVAVVSRIAALSDEQALQFVQRWRFLASPIHIRLWAAAAKSFEFVPTAHVANFLVELDDGEFWDLHTFPEIAELRAARFHELDVETQQLLADRLTKGPPRKFWPRKVEPEKVKSGRLYWTVRELNRVHIAGGDLPDRARHLLAANITRFTDLREMSPNEGFPEGPIVRDVLPEPDDRYDALEGIARLRALEAALGSSRGGWNNDPAGRADDWLRQTGKAALALNDLETAEHGGDEFPRVWERLGWTHAPGQQEAEGSPNRDLQHEANRVLALLVELSEKTLRMAIEGVSNWLDHWRHQVVASQKGYAVWFRVWPIAVITTNEKGENTTDTDLIVSVSSGDDSRETMDLDTLNTSAGKLVGVFLAACPSLNDIQHPFETNDTLRQMRDALALADGRSGLIAQHRLIEALPYFLRADHTWTTEHLIRPLLNDDAASLALWRAIARRTRYFDVLAIIGGAMAERAIDRRLGRETRRGLVFSLVVDTLHAFRENRDPAVSNSRVTQMLRTLDDELRAYAASTIEQFVSEVSASQSENAELFRSAAAPFLQKVWPQERSLTTPGVSKGLADLPAASGEAFAEAVGAIERFLVPFECWSMLDYGLYGDEDDVKKLSMIDDVAKAQALLRLLDLTVGVSEGAVIPYDLTDALDQIRAVAPQLAEAPTYRRLSTAARRL